VAKNDKIQTPKDFRGKRIGTPQMEGTSFIGLQLFLQQYNLQNQVKIEKIGYTQIPSLMSGKIEGAVCFFNNEPLKLKQLGAQLHQWDVKDFSDIVGASFITSQVLASKKGTVLKGFAQATIKAMEYTCQHQPEALQITLPYIDQQENPDEAFLQEVLATTCQLFESPTGYGTVNLDTYNYSIQTLHELRFIEHVYPAEKIVYRPSDS
jgi:ABC-type nitrate/sulfonate/bicarbonate transport system substrate-binding protein